MRIQYVHGTKVLRPQMQVRLEVIEPTFREQVMAYSIKAAKTFGIIAFFGLGFAANPAVFIASAIITFAVTLPAFLMRR